MIVKNLTSKTPRFRRVLSYIVSGITPFPGLSKDAYILTHNVDGSTVDEWTQAFLDNEKGRKRHRKNQIYIHHTILSWHEADRPHLTREILLDLTRQYIREHSPFGLYVAGIHTDTGHPHVHICGSTIAYGSGASLRMSRTEYQGLKRSLEQYQEIQYPQLLFSRVRHGQRLSRVQVRKLIEAVMETAANQKEVLEQLQELGFTPYWRGKKVVGLQFGGRKYRFSGFEKSLE